MESLRPYVFLSQALASSKAAGIVSYFLSIVMTAASQTYPLFRLLSYMKPFQWQYRLATFYSFMNKLFDIFPEILIGGAVDVVVNQRASWIAKLTGMEDMSMQLFLLGLLTFLAWGFESVFQYLYSIQWRNLAQTVEHRLRMDCYRHIQNARLEDVERTPIGQIIAIMNDDINQLERFLEDGINQIIQIIVSTVLIGLVFLVCSPLITVFAILPIPFILMGAFYFQHRLEPKFMNVRQKAADISSALANNLQGLVTIKSYTAEEREAETMAAHSNAYQQANRETIKISSMVTPVIRIAILTGFLFTLLIGGYQTIDGSMNVGVFSLLIFLSQRLLWPFSSLADVTVNYQRVMASTRRALDLLLWPTEETERGDDVSKGNQVISFEQVNFAYPGGNKTLFNDFSILIPKNSTVAFVGESGSGKSTLIKLLSRFYSPDGGQIRFDGDDIENYSKASWRKQIALVSQEVYLFSGSILDNIAYGSPEADQAQIIAAAKTAGVDRFVDQFPEGYHQAVGERGHSLSGGQRQRIAIARAILKQAPILILDEATSAVDNDTELAIAEALKAISHNKTTIIIAHRLSTIRHADEILVMDKGRIIEQGAHDDLVSLQGHYHRLWQIQTGENITANYTRDPS